MLSPSKLRSLRSSLKSTVSDALSDAFTRKVCEKSMSVIEQFKTGVDKSDKDILKGALITISVFRGSELHSSFAQNEREILRQFFWAYFLVWLDTHPQNKQEDIMKLLKSINHDKIDEKSEKKYISGLLEHLTKSSKKIDFTTISSALFTKTVKELGNPEVLDLALLLATVQLNENRWNNFLSQKEEDRKQSRSSSKSSTSKKTKRHTGKKSTSSVASNPSYMIDISSSSSTPTYESAEIMMEVREKYLSGGDKSSYGLHAMNEADVKNYFSISVPENLVSIIENKCNETKGQKGEIGRGTFNKVYDVAPYALRVSICKKVNECSEEKEAEMKKRKYLTDVILAINMGELAPTYYDSFFLKTIKSCINVSVMEKLELFDTYAEDMSYKQVIFDQLLSMNKTLEEKNQVYLDFKPDNVLVRINEKQKKIGVKIKAIKLVFGDIDSKFICPLPLIDGAESLSTWSRMYRLFFIGQIPFTRNRNIFYDLIKQDDIDFWNENVLTFIRKKTNPDISNIFTHYLPCYKVLRSHFQDSNFKDLQKSNEIFASYIQLPDTITSRLKLLVEKNSHRYTSEEERENLYVNYNANKFHDALKMCFDKNVENGKIPLPHKIYPHDIAFYIQAETTDIVRNKLRKMGPVQLHDDLKRHMILEEVIFNDEPHSFTKHAISFPKETNERSKSKKDVLFILVKYIWEQYLPKVDKTELVQINKGKQGKKMYSVWNIASRRFEDEFLKDTDKPVLETILNELNSPSDEQMFSLTMLKKLVPESNPRANYAEFLFGHLKYE